MIWKELSTLIRSQDLTQGNWHVSQELNFITRKGSVILDPVTFTSRESERWKGIVHGECWWVCAAGMECVGRRRAKITQLLFNINFYHFLPSFFSWPFFFMDYLLTVFPKSVYFLYFKQHKIEWLRWKCISKCCVIDSRTWEDEQK